MFALNQILASAAAGLLLAGACVTSQAAELPAGTVIDKSNVDQIKGDTFEGHTIASLLTDKIEWQIKNWNLKIPLGHSKPQELDPRFVEATKKYSGQVKFDTQTREVSGWVAGLPFPDV